MTTYNIIAIGGTGARCIEALIHSCAAGLGPKELTEISILILDSDETNGNTEILKNVISKYQKCYKMYKSVDTSIFKVKVDYSGERITWTPSKRGSSLNEYFNYNTLTTSNKALGDIFNLLYTKDEINLKWDRGFNGRSSIGAPVMAKIKAHLDKNPWSEITQNIGQNLGNANDARLFIFASIFGAAGASGFPIVADILKERIQGDGFHVGGALMLPYFGFQTPSNVKGIVASPKNFLLKSKAALKHYSSIWDEHTSPFNAIYLLGEKTLDMIEDDLNRKFSTGGPDQDNFAHYIELLAVFASFDFYQKKINQKYQQLTVARKKLNKIDWSDFPLEDLKPKLTYFTTLAFSFRGFYYNLLKDNNFKKRKYLAPWYVDCFESLDLNFEDENLEIVYEYFETYLRWMYEMSFSTSKDLHLINSNVLKISKKNDFRELNDEYLKNLIFDSQPDCSFGYDALWKELCDLQTSLEEGPPNPTGKLLYLLYKASEAFCEKNYSGLKRRED